MPLVEVLPYPAMIAEFRMQDHPLRENFSFLCSFLHPFYLHRRFSVANMTPDFACAIIANRAILSTTFIFHLAFALRSHINTSGAVTRGKPFQRFVLHAIYQTLLTPQTNYRKHQKRRKHRPCQHTRQRLVHPFPAID